MIIDPLTVSVPVVFFIIKYATRSMELSEGQKGRVKESDKKELAYSNQFELVGVV